MGAGSYRRGRRSAHAGSTVLVRRGAGFIQIGPCFRSCVHTGAEPISIARVLFRDAADNGNINEGKAIRVRDSHGSRVCRNETRPRAVRRSNESPRGARRRVYRFSKSLGRRTIDRAAIQVKRRLCAFAGFHSYPSGTGGTTLELRRKGCVQACAREPGLGEHVWLGCFLGACPARLAPEIHQVFPVQESVRAVRDLTRDCKFSERSCVAITLTVFLRINCGKGYG